MDMNMGDGGGGAVQAEVETLARDQHRRWNSHGGQDGEVEGSHGSAASTSGGGGGASP